MTDQPPDYSRSLQELDGCDWGDPEDNDTPMVKTLYAIRRKPMTGLTDGELRLAVSQRVGEPFIVWLAIDRLEQTPLLDGDCYPGDILSALIRQTDQVVWDANPHLKDKLTALYKRALEKAADETESFRESLGLPLSGSQ
jgi:CDI immunity proteins